jgi:multisubunit Na+/H+ antiporter MnhE subunit
MTSILISSVFYIGLFLGLCIAVVVGIAFYNIFTKSFRPTRSILVIVSVSILLLVNGFLALDSLNRVLRQISSGNIPGTQQPNSNNGTSLF